MKKDAFTLAEVLITLGIIGVVAAMTLPSLITNYKNKQTVSQLKKIYSSMSQAYVMAKSEYGPMDDWGMSGRIEDEDGNLQYNQNDASIIANKFAPYLKTLKICKDSNNCWYNENLKSLSGKLTNNNFSADGKTRVSMILADGGMISLVSISPDCSNNRGDGMLSKVCGAFAVDVNGSKKPNQIGRDVFQFYFTKEGIVPYGLPSDNSFPFETSCSVKNDQGFGCTAWVIYNENLDYLYCDDLDWNSKTHCK